MSSHHAGSLEGAYTSVINSMWALKLPSLKALAKSLSIANSGRKADVQDRIKRYLRIGVDSNDEVRLWVVNELVQQVAMYGYITSSYDTLYLRRSNGTSSVSRSSSSLSSSQPKPTQVQTKQPWLFFHENPFFVLKKLVTPNAGYCSKAPSGRGICTLSFILNEHDQDLLKNDGSFKLFLMCGIYDKNKPNTDAFIEFPHPLEIYLNTQQVKDNVKGLKNKPGSSRPANLTPFIRPNAGTLNELKIVYAFTKSDYLLFCYLVEQIKPEKLLLKILENPHILKESTLNEFNVEEQDEDDLKEMATRLSLKCPLSFTRMKYPVKGIFCKHLACFDALSYLYLQEQVATWLCPICNHPVKVKELCISDYVMEIVNKTPSNVESAEIDTDGSWKPVYEEGEELDDEDDEDDEDNNFIPSFKRQDLGKDKSPSKGLNSPIVIVLDSDEEDDDVIVTPAPTSTSTLPPHSASTKQKETEKQNHSTNERTPSGIHPLPSNVQPQASTSPQFQNIPYGGIPMHQVNNAHHAYYSHQPSFSTSFPQDIVPPPQYRMHPSFNQPQFSHGSYGSPSPVQETPHIDNLNQSSRAGSYSHSPEGNHNFASLGSGSDPNFSLQAITHNSSHYSESSNSNPVQSSSSSSTNIGGISNSEQQTPAQSTSTDPSIRTDISQNSVQKNATQSVTHGPNNQVSTSNEVQPTVSYGSHQAQSNNSVEDQQAGISYPVTSNIQIHQEQLPPLHSLSSNPNTGVEKTTTSHYSPQNAVRGRESTGLTPNLSSLPIPPPHTASRQIPSSLFDALNKPATESSHEQGLSTSKQNNPQDPKPSLSGPAPPPHTSSHSVRSSLFDVAAIVNKSGQEVPSRSVSNPTVVTTAQNDLQTKLQSLKQNLQRHNTVANGNVVGNEQAMNRIKQLQKALDAKNSGSSSSATPTPSPSDPQANTFAQSRTASSNISASTDLSSTKAQDSINEDPFISRSAVPASELHPSPTKPPTSNVAPALHIPSWSQNNLLRGNNTANLPSTTTATANGVNENEEERLDFALQGSVSPAINNETIVERETSAPVNSDVGLLGIPKIVLDSIKKPIANLDQNESRKRPNEQIPDSVANKKPALSDNEIDDR